MGSFQNKATLSLTISMGGLATGFTGGILVPATYFSNIIYEMPNGYQEGTRVSVISTLYGSIGGAIFTGILMNFLGRKLMLNSLVMPYVIGWLSILAFEIPQMIYFGRALIGLSMGGFSVISPIYLSEMAEVWCRGSMVFVFTLLVRVGFFFGFILTMWQGSTRMELMSVLLFVSTTILFLPSFFIPESPMLLILQKKESEAIEVLKSIRNSDYDIDRELDDIKLQVEGLKHGSLYFASSLKRRGTKRALLTMIILCFVQQSTFISAYMFWASESGMIMALEHNFFWFAVMVQILVQMIGVFSSLITIDSSGRRTLLLISAALVMISTMGLAIRILYYDDQWLQNINQVDIIFTTSATIMHSVGLTTIPWLLTTEMYTPDIKWLGGVISAVFAWSRRLAVSEFLYFYDKEMVFRVNVVLASISAAIGILVAFFLVIETRNRKMGEIHEILNGGRIEK